LAPLETGARFAFAVFYELAKRGCSKSAGNEAGLLNLRSKMKELNVNMKKLLFFTLLLFVCAGPGSETLAQRKAVSGTEVTGTFRSYYTGKFKGNYNEILIQALGGNKLKIEMGLTYPFVVNGEMSANLGSASGEAVINGDTAVFVPDGDADEKLCKITLRFPQPGTLIVKTEGNLHCGFGLNVSADGTYKKVSGAKPKFGANQ
jgi:hypothetical protein